MPVRNKTKCPSIPTCSCLHVNLIKIVFLMAEAHIQGGEGGVYKKTTLTRTP